MEKITRLAAGTIQVKCSVAGERIKRLEINGDFFAGRTLERLCESLIDCEYRKEKVEERLAEHYCDNLIYGISKEELLEAIF